MRELIKTYIHAGGIGEKSGAEKGSYKCLTLALLISHITPAHVYLLESSLSISLLPLTWPHSVNLLNSTVFQRDWYILPT